MMKRCYLVLCLMLVLVGRAGYSQSVEGVLDSQRHPDFKSFEHKTVKHLGFYIHYEARYEKDLPGVKQALAEVTAHVKRNIATHEKLIEAAPEIVREIMGYVLSAEKIKEVPESYFESLTKRFVTHNRVGMKRQATIIEKTHLYLSESAGVQKHFEAGGRIPNVVYDPHTKTAQIRVAIQGIEAEGKKYIGKLYPVDGQRFDLPIRFNDEEDVVKKVEQNLDLLTNYTVDILPVLTYQPIVRTIILSEMRNVSTNSFWLPSGFSAALSPRIAKGRVPKALIEVYQKHALFNTKAYTSENLKHVDLYNWVVLKFWLYHESFVSNDYYKARLAYAKQVADALIQKHGQQVLVKITDALDADQHEVYLNRDVEKAVLEATGFDVPKEFQKFNRFKGMSALEQFKGYQSLYAKLPEVFPFGPENTAQEKRIAQQKLYYLNRMYELFLQDPKNEDRATVMPIFIAIQLQILGESQVADRIMAGQVAYHLKHKDTFDAHRQVMAYYAGANKPMFSVAYIDLVRKQYPKNTWAITFKLAQAVVKRDKEKISEIRKTLLREGLKITRSQFEFAKKQDKGGAGAP